MTSKSVKRAVLKRAKQLRSKGSSCKNEADGDRKVITTSSDQLKWKPVGIPETLDDYEGFYGLEEIDGVDVKVVNGQLHYIVSDETRLADEKERKAAKAAEKSILEGNFMVEQSEGEDAEDGEEGEDEEVVEESADGAGDSLQEGASEQPEQLSEEASIDELERADFNADEKDIPQIPGEQKQDTMLERKTNSENALCENAFTKLKGITLEELPTDEVDLPKWKDIPISSYILNALSKLNFTEPTAIQKETIPTAMEGSDVIGKAMTGSGKTLAYGIPILEKAIADDDQGLNHPTGLIFAPTRELAAQVAKHLKLMVKYSPLSDKSVVSLTGGLSIQKQERLISYNPRVIVATPGRCLELLEKSTSVATQLASTDILVFDEADRLVEDGHFDELEKILDILRNNRAAGNAVTHRWQSLVFSATFNADLFGKLAKQKRPEHNGKRRFDDDDDAAAKEAERRQVLDLLGKKLRLRGKPAYIDVNPTDFVADRITEALIPCSPMDRDLMLYYFLSIFPGNTLVFANSIDCVKRLKPMLNSLRIPTVSLHSSMIQKQRLRSLERFQLSCKQAAKENRSSVLIASDVAARGLDIPGIQHVVHYHLPRTADTYIHRSGRTARAGREGVSIVLCSPQEASGPLHKLRKLVSNKKEQSLDDLKMLPIDTDIVGQLKERLEIASKLAKADIATKDASQEQKWLEKAADDLGLEGWDEIGEDDYLKRDKKRLQGKQLDRRSKNALKGELKSLLSRPIRKGRNSYLTNGLSNIAELLLKKEGSGNQDVMSYLQKDALSVLNSGKKRKVDSSSAQK
ncbi:DEKNAAC100420 [Brettanomyces naardenensis]|uniref:RNA helicase n=1 Tax=Brettanomyces naardenensis TaxID=13370 RepID=A0A448YFP2_BRENA|nr:DEKNAAC100420 [Brettanomyces naardenensis]